MVLCVPIGAPGPHENDVRGSEQSARKAVIGFGVVDAGWEVVVVYSYLSPPVVQVVGSEDVVTAEVRLGAELVLAVEVPPEVKVVGDGRDAEVCYLMQHRLAFLDGAASDREAVRLRVDEDVGLEPFNELGYIDSANGSFLESLHRMTECFQRCRDV